MTETFVEKLARAKWHFWQGSEGAKKQPYYSLLEKQQAELCDEVLAMLRAAPGAVDPRLLSDLREARRDLQGFVRIVRAALAEHDQKNEDAA